MEDVIEILEILMEMENRHYSFCAKNKKNLCKITNAIRIHSVNDVTQFQVVETAPT